MSLSSPFNASPYPLNPSPSPYKASSQSINKTSISPKSSANRAQRRTDPHNDLVFRQQGGGPPRGYDRITEAMGKAFDPVLVLRGTKKCIKFVEHKYFDQTSKSGGYAGWFSLGVQNIIMHNLKLMRNLTGRQCNCFRKGRERLKRDALLITLARQFCTIAMSFSEML